MDMTKLAEALQETLGATLPGVLGAVGILLAGWFVAVAIRAGVKKKTWSSPAQQTAWDLSWGHDGC